MPSLKKGSGREDKFGDWPEGGISYRDEVNAEQSTQIDRPTHHPVSVIQSQ